ncbi:MAG: YbaK/EbsC family protein [Gemmatimonadota bacterium]|jgi:Ala-tRNA(Pro) deacylase
MLCKERLEQFLRDAGVKHEYQRHSAAFTAQEVAAAEHVPGRMLAKVVIVIADDTLAMTVVPAPSKVDMEKVCAVMGAGEARVAREGEFAEAFPDCDVGAMPVFGNLYDVPVLADRALAENQTIISQAGSHTETVSVAYADFERLVNPKVADLTVHD